MRRRPKVALTVIHYARGDDEFEIAGRVRFGEPARTYGPPDDCSPGGDDEVDDISVLRNGDKLSDEVVAKLGLAWGEIEERLIAEARDDSMNDNYADEWREEE